MPDNFQQYRRTTARRDGHDYRRSATYFVTIVTADRLCLFGEAAGNAVVLNSLGRAVNDAWRASADIRPGVSLGEFVVMPNHLHALVHLPTAPTGVWGGEAHDDSIGRPIVSRSLGALIRGFKGDATRRVNAIRNAPGRPLWQANYHEHIVRTEASLKAIGRYIRVNPDRWPLDPENVTGSPDEWER